MARVRTPLVLCVFVVLAMAALPAHATSLAACEFSADVTLDPGLSNGQIPNADPPLVGTTGTFTTESGGNLETGTITCTGMLFDRDVVGEGTVGFAGSYGQTLAGDTCLYGTGQGAFSATIPVADGDDEGTDPDLIHLEGLFLFGRAAVAGGFAGVLTPDLDGGIAGVFEFTPAEGQDCLNTAVTNAAVSGTASIFQDPVLHP